MRLNAEGVTGNQEAERVRCRLHHLPRWIHEADLSRLTEREREILAMLGDCRTNKVIAGLFHITERTVKKHVTSIFAKLDISSRSEAAVIATYKECGPRCPSGH